ncbi:hypothetical protein KXW60_002572 [Aspergillus fumigatus]|nr:hypothetical protein KXW88_001543 [Aspergillus fumigatus]KAH2652125.1 hypothetical protein KXV32_004164 [Aspergillus fumigatus]KAH3023895.1 hypothetical protein KXW60_002572 [Aspergillus fumigatus]KAH3269563.1 hypothetical protein KXW55_003793 [Aspergillus fumigatus]
MGLAAPRKKTKISHDPNNTSWSRSTDGFGHRILKAQGWTPGDFLGARNATHSDLFTTASASHIRVVLKDDTLGLGARPKRDLLDGPTGLDAFKGLLGRLNGKSDTQLEAEQQKRDDAKLARYAATKWQTVRFISGGLLVQEKDNATASPASQDLRVDFPRETSSNEHENGMFKTEPMDSDSHQEGCATAREEEGKKKKKKNKKGKEMDMSPRKSREKKKEKIQKKRKIGDCDRLDTETADRTSTKVLVAVANDKGTSLLASNGPSTSRERQPMGRRIFRSRHIEQKKRALMDDKSLNETYDESPMPRKTYSQFSSLKEREYALAMGLASVSRESCENLLSKGGADGEGMGRAITIVIGGARESLHALPHSLRLVLKCRKGFIRLAIRTGADLVPVLAFGENDLYEQVRSDQHPIIHKLQMLIKRTMGFTVPLFHARGVFNYDVGLMPYRRPLNIVVGRPIQVVQQRDRDKIDETYIDDLHAKYIQELRRLWEQYKDVFAKDRISEIEIVA